jgi:hypothetical protein
MIFGYPQEKDPSKDSSFIHTLHFARHKNKNKKQIHHYYRILLKKNPANENYIVAVPLSFFP